MNHASLVRQCTEVADYGAAGFVVGVSRDRSGNGDRVLVPIEAKAHDGAIAESFPVPRGGELLHYLNWNFFQKFEASEAKTFVFKSSDDLSDKMSSDSLGCHKYKGVFIQ